MSPKHLTGIKYINTKHFGPLWNLLYTHESPKTTIFSYSIIQGGQWGLEDYGTTIFIGPRCPWGPIYGSGSLKLTD